MCYFWIGTAIWLRVVSLTELKLPMNEELRREIARRERAKEALQREIDERRQAESRFRELVEGLDAIVWEADATTWQFNFVSRRAEDILGYPVEQWTEEPN